MRAIQNIWKEFRARLQIVSWVAANAKTDSRKRLDEKRREIREKYHPGFAKKILTEGEINRAENIGIGFGFLAIAIVLLIVGFVVVGWLLS